MLQDENHVSRSTYIFGCYVIVDVGRKYVVFQALNFAIKILKKTPHHEFGLPVVRHAGSGRA